VRPIITSSADDHIGLAVVRSLGKKNINFQVVSTTKNTIARHSRYCKSSAIGKFDLDFFSRFSKDDIVYPMIEDTMLLLSKHRSELKCQLAFSDYETILKSRDKFLLTRHALDQNIPCPKTFFISNPGDIEEHLPDIGFPTVLKPSRGAGGKGITYIEFPELLPGIAKTFLAEYGPFLLQEKIPFTSKYTVGAICNSDHELRRVCVIKELRNFPVETGQACYAETVDFPGLVSLTEKLLKSLNFIGVADIDFIMDPRDNQPKLMEINPRFWGSVQVAINAGVDFPCLLYSMMKDGDIEKSLNYKKGVRCRYVVFTDLQRLSEYLQGVYSSKNKINALKDFLHFPKDDGYYVYSLDDLLPLMSLAYVKMERKFHFDTFNPVTDDSSK
jgi:predicted ATP-grasp superfamily ATP-dependent carboligase